MSKVFFSYSHVDEVLRDQLEVHLAMLKRQGFIEAWHDRRIVAGSDVGAAVDNNLEAADIILLLVSADFLDSDYCYSREMKRALERHEKGEGRVIPVILRPCDWHAAPFGKLLAIPRDGKAITTWPNQDEALADTARHIRSAVEELHKIGQPRSDATLPFTAGPARTASDSGAAVATASKDIPRSSNLRLKKEFSQLDRDRFLSETFAFIARFFESSMTELAARNPGIEGRFQPIDAGRFAAIIYRNGKALAECSIRLDGLGGKRSGGIAFSYDASTQGGSFNEMLHIEADGQSLYFQPLGLPSFGGKSESHLSAEGAAEYFWDLLIRPLQG